MALIAVVVLSGAARGQLVDLEARAIAAAKTVSTRALDPALPDVAFESWLRTELRPVHDVAWEASDCGESTGDPAIDGGRDLPLCVDASATSPEGVTVTVQLVLGTWRAGLTDGPRVWAVFARGAGERRSTRSALRDLRRRLESSRVSRGVRVLWFSVTSVQTEIRQRLDRHLELVVRNARHAEGYSMGWDLVVLDRRLGASPNFLEGELWGHGPRLHDFYAWHFAEDHLPLNRTLPVYGYPLELDVACQECTTIDGDGRSTFAAGWLEISWRRLRVANPPQRRSRSRVGTRR